MKAGPRLTVLESVTNRGEYLSPHYLAEVLPTTLRSGTFKRWGDEEKGGRVTPRLGLRRLRRHFFEERAELTAETTDPERLRKLTRELNGHLLQALGFDPHPGPLTVERAGRTHEIPVAHAEPGIVALDAGWAVDADAAQNPTGAGLLLDPVRLETREEIPAAAKLASWLFAADTDAPRYVLILHGGVVTLADRTVWGEGRYLAASLDTAFGRNDDAELGIVAALFGADALRPPAEGGSEPLAEMLAGSRQHAEGVSGSLRLGLRTSVELIANEVLDRIREAGHQPQDVMELDELARRLTREALRYLYRILFLLYAEARPELGVLPVDDPEYVEGYSMARLGDLIARKLAPSAEHGFHLYESLDLLANLVNGGYRARHGAEAGESEGVGLRFEPMYSDLFLPDAIGLIGRRLVAPDADPDDADAPRLDTRLRNATLYRVLRLLMLRKGTGRRGRAGFISYAQLGINQLGAVYEGLMSYTGFVAVEQLYEVAKDGDPEDGSWMIPASRAHEYPDDVFVQRENPITEIRSRVSYPPGSFVYRLAGRDRQTSASYYTPHSLTSVTVQLALRYRLDQNGTTTPSRELLDWTICEPALGSGAFLNEAINQVAAEYLRRRQEELKEQLDPEQYHLELQRAKAYIALHNCYGVDLNRTAVELAEVSLWLNVMHTGLQAPWFGLHLRRGNSLIGAGRRLYTAEQLLDCAWLTTSPADRPLCDGPIDDGAIHHFLLAADGWGAVAGEKEARSLAPEAAKRLGRWRTAIKKEPSTKRARRKPSQVERLAALARRVELLWTLVGQRLEISEREIRRAIPLWGAADLPSAGAVERGRILADLTTPGTPYWRLKTLMDAWCALWFWPVDAVGLLDGSDPDYACPDYTEETAEVRHVEAPAFLADAQTMSLFADHESAQLALPSATTPKKHAVPPPPARARIPLADLEDWIEFADALLGRVDIPDGALFSSFTTLDELGEYENDLVALTGMDQPYRLADRFPWLQTAVRIAEQQGFFHWELDFAQAFARGGFDLQVGNPPWVRPELGANTALAEFDPWFELAADSKVASQRRSRVLETHASAFISMVSAVSVSSKFLAAPANYAELAGISANLYRNFMVRAWRSANPSGVSALIHYDTHFNGAADVPFRSVTYSRLRLHAHFQNRRLIFPEVDWNKQFSVNVYGSPRQARFAHLSWLFDPLTLIRSFEHDGVGELPGLKKGGEWDLRPHRDRIFVVDEQLLANWRELSGERNYPALHGRLLYPVSRGEQSVIQALIDARPKIIDFTPRISRGISESSTRKDSPIVKVLFDPPTWSEVILKGPQLSIATPFAKRPPIPKRSGRPMDLTTLEVDAVPRSEFRYREGVQVRDAASEQWVDYAEVDRLLQDDGEVEAVRETIAKELNCLAASVSLRSVRDFLEARSTRPAVSFYRVAWREWVPAATERSLFPALIPAGPNHVHAVRSMAMRDRRRTVLAGACLAGLPIDYAVRVAGREHLDGTDIGALPVVSPLHPLSAPLLLRTLRLNCLTEAYGDLWEELFEPSFRSDQWAFDWPVSRPLSVESSRWEGGVPLRTECERRAALVEIDALVAVYLNVNADGLVTMYRSRFPQLQTYEESTYFDVRERRIAADFDAYGFGQTKEHYQELVAYLDNPKDNPIPNGYAAPFYKADREGEYRAAHAVFSRRLQDAVDAGWEPT